MRTGWRGARVGRGGALAGKRKRRDGAPARTSPGGGSEGARFPGAPRRSELPREYAIALRDIKSRIRKERVRVVLAANAALVLFYWDLGRLIIHWQHRHGWGARVIDRLSLDLRAAFPDMRGFSPRNLKYMRAFAAAWPKRAIVQGPLAQIPW